MVQVIQRPSLSLIRTEVAPCGVHCICFDCVANRMELVVTIELEGVHLYR